MQGSFVFLNKNSYTKDGNYRCYASFADGQGNVLSFNASAYQGQFPQVFSICHLDFDVQQFGNNNTAFILSKLQVTGRLVDPQEK